MIANTPRGVEKGDFFLEALCKYPSLSSGIEEGGEGIFFFSIRRQGVRYRHRFFLIVAKCQKPLNFCFFTSA